MTAALEGVEWSAVHPGRNLPPAKTRYPFYRRLGGSQGRSGRAEKLVPTGIRSRSVQPVVSRYWESTGTKYRSFLVSTVSSRGHVCNSGFPETGVEVFNISTLNVYPLIIGENINTRRNGVSAMAEV